MGALQTPPQTKHNTSTKPEQYTEKAKIKTKKRKKRKLKSQLQHVSIHIYEQNKINKNSLIVARDSVVVGRVVEHQGQHALLLQVGLVDASERLHHHRAPAEVPGLQRRVLSGRPLPVVVVTDHHPTGPIRLVLSRYVRHLAEFPSFLLCRIVPQAGKHAGTQWGKWYTA